MAGILGSDGSNHAKLRRNHIQLLAGLLSDAYHRRPALTVFLLFGNIDENFFPGKSFGQRLPFCLPARVLGNANQLLGPFSVRLTGLRFVEEPQLPLSASLRASLLRSEKTPLQPGQLFGKNIDLLCKLSAFACQLSILLPQLRILAHQRLDVPLHGAQPSTTQ